ncbi:MAG: phosphoribosylamine--glycine ligase [Muribaculaceae bacterium]|nr:phosphoribosylamine--glycine ligase [Muribaculaceae bacterium]
MDKGKKVLVVGSGGREHAIVKSLAKSPKVAEIFCAPGNAGIANDAKCLPIKVDDVEGLVNFAQRNHIDLTVIGPEAALVAGLADAMLQNDIRVFGPTKGATQIESSKEFAKMLMEKYGIPTGKYKSFSAFEDALDYVKKGSFPSVIKYDGLAAGKGVVIAQNLKDAEIALREMLHDHKFGDDKVIIEEFLEGPEFSFMCFVSGEKVYPLELAQDHKRAFDGDKGPNTGGMGAYSPVPFISEKVKNEALEKIMKPTAKALMDMGLPFCGVLYGGLILTQEGPKVIEFNARFGDPETEVVLPRLESDLFDFINYAIEGKGFIPQWSHDAVIGVVLASKGYPGSYKKGEEIKGLENIQTEVFHMGTAEMNGKFHVAGGRVLMVTAHGDDLPEAALNVEKEIKLIECPSLFHRTDIGKYVLNTESK